MFLNFCYILNIFFVASCSKQNYNVTKIEGKRITITEKKTKFLKLKILSNHREHINNDLDSILAYCPETLDKSTGKWQTTIGNLMADVTLSRGNTVFNPRKKEYRYCLLNSGGIRSILQR
jgi:hypothetical protein